jgi:predicted DNA-binding transcriptional regulator AlpA
MPQPTDGWQIVREPERKAMMGISRVTMWRLEREGLAPKRIQIGENSVGWLRHEIEGWIKRKAAGR